MEFHETLQHLRKQRGLTQEELAAQLFVSRTAVSKWESGRGFPSIDSLKAVAAFFAVSLDELLSGEEIVAIAEEDHRQKQHTLQDLVCGLLDLCTTLWLFLPLFGQDINGAVQTVSLLTLSASPYLKATYTALVIGTALFGLLTLALQTCRHPLWLRGKRIVSLCLSGAGVCLFILSRQPYAALSAFAFLIVKALILAKRS